VLKFALYTVIILVVAFLGVIFAARNETEIALDFFLTQPISMRIGFWVLLSFIAGCLVAWLLVLPSYMALKLINKNQSRKIKKQQGELLLLKGESAKGN